MQSHDGNLTISAYHSYFINVEILRRLKSGVLLSKLFTLATHLKVFKLKAVMHITCKGLDTVVSLSAGDEKKPAKA